VIDATENQGACVSVTVTEPDGTVRIGLHEPAVTVTDPIPVTAKVNVGVVFMVKPAGMPANVLQILTEPVVAAFAPTAEMATSEDEAINKPITPANAFRTNEYFIWLPLNEY
jgi:hypothetical protein